MLHRALLCIFAFFYSYRENTCHRCMKLASNDSKDIISYMHSRECQALSSLKKVITKNAFPDISLQLLFLKKLL